MHYTATIDAIGLNEPATEFQATVELSDHVRIIAIDESPFWVMCELIKALKQMEVQGSIEGFYNGEPVLDTIAGNGLPLS